jgi:hypothetical protein
MMTLCSIFGNIYAVRKKMIGYFTKGKQDFGSRLLAAEGEWEGGQ